MKKSFKSLKEEAKKINAKILYRYEDYVNNSTRLPYQCLSCKNKWKPTAGSVKSGRICPDCSKLKVATSRKANSHTIKELRVAANKKGGDCLSEVYDGIDTKHLFICHKKHTWWTSAYNILAEKSWCPVCYGRFDKLDEVKSIVESRGGRLLSKKYLGVMRKYDLECSEGHKFTKILTKLRVGQWCPECSSHLYERICRYAIETMTGKPFKKAHPTWLKTHQNKQMELDGYNDELKLAFEHQGYQHYFNKSIIKRDKLKKTILRKHNIKLIEIPELTTKLPLQALEDFLLKKLMKNKIPLSAKYKRFGLDLNKGYIRNNLITDQNRILAGSGIVCLSKTYLGIDENHQYQCLKCKHRFERSFYSASKSQSCPNCQRGKLGTNTLKTYDEIMTSAKKVSLVPMFKYAEYKHNTIKMKYRCTQCKTINRISLAKINMGNGCSTCSKNLKIRLLTNTKIKEMRNLAKDRNGTLVSTEYVNGRHMYDWKCKNGHTWSASWENVKDTKSKRGSWCKECSNIELSESRRTPIEVIQKNAKAMKLKILSGLKNYKNGRSPIKIKCLSCGSSKQTKMTFIMQKRSCINCKTKQRRLNAKKQTR